MTCIPYGVVLAGGRSRRMGQDKAVVEVAGERLVDRAVRMLSTVCATVIVSSGSTRYIEGLAVDQLSDDVDDAGPLAGITVALEWAGAGDVAIVAVDVVDIAGGVLLHCAEQRRGAVAAVPEAGGRPQPLHAVWGAEHHREVRAAFRRGERSPSRFLVGAGARTLDPGEWQPHDLTDGRFASSYNRPSDLAERPVAGGADTALDADDEGTVGVE